MLQISLNFIKNNYFRIKSNAALKIRQYLKLDNIHVLPCLHFSSVWETKRTTGSNWQWVTHLQMSVGLLRLIHCHNLFIYEKNVCPWGLKCNRKCHLKIHWPWTDHGQTLRNKASHADAHSSASLTFNHSRSCAAFRLGQLGHTSGLTKPFTSYTSYDQDDGFHNTLKSSKDLPSLRYI